MKQRTTKQSNLGKSRQGAVLLITLLTVSLLLLVVLAFVVVVRMELRKVVAQQQLALARGNAMLGAELAIARLQELTGPDTRVTAPVLSGAGLPNAQWIGQAVDAAAYRSRAGGGLELNPDHARPLGFLLSGEDFDPAGFQPFAAGAPRPDHALLVGPGTVSNPRDRNGDGVPDEHVAAPLVAVTGPAPGAFAWWIGDEGMKAQVNVTDALDANPNFSPEGRQRARRATAQRTGGEVVLSGYDPNNANHNQILSRSLTLGHLNVTPGHELAPASAPVSFHDISLQSLGLPTNTRRGGLQRDLTAVFREAEANGGNANKAGAQWAQLMAFQRERIARWRAETVALETAGQLGAAAGADRHANARQALTLRADQANPALADRIFPPLSDLHVQWDQGGAAWEQLVTWPTLRQRRGNPALAPEGRWQETMEVGPVIAKVAISAYATVDYPEASLHLVPTVVLWNPYNESMRIPSNLRLVMSYDQGHVNFLMRLRVSHPNWNVNHLVFSGGSGASPANFTHIPQSPATGGSLLFTPSFLFRWNPDGAGTHREHFVFTFRNAAGGGVEIEPGQARIFTMHRHLDVTPGTAGGSFSTAAELREGIPSVPGQFGYILRENLEDQMDNNVRSPHPGSFGGGPNSWTAHREARDGYNIWHPTGIGGGNGNSPPQSLPYPFPLSHPDNEAAGTPGRLTGGGGRLIYAAADAPPDNLCINKHYLRGWTVEEIGLELGAMGNEPTRFLGGVGLRMDQGAGTLPMVEVFNLNGTLPRGLSHARLCDVDNRNINKLTGLRFQDTAIQLPVPAESRPPNLTDPLPYAMPIWGLSYGLRLPENAYNYDVETGGSEGGVGGSLAAPARWLVDINPVAPYAGRDPAGRSVAASDQSRRQVNNSASVTSKAGFQSPGAYSGGFFMQSDRLGNLLMSTPDDLNQFIGATDAANPDWSGGPPRAIVYEIPRDSGDIVSVASLMQAPLSPTSHALMPSNARDLPGPWTSGTPAYPRSWLPYWLNRSTTNYGFMQPAHMIGNARAHLMVRRELAVQSFYPSLSFPTPGSHGEAIPYAASRNPLGFVYGAPLGSGLHRNPPASFFPGYDSSWVYNEVLWDDFLFTPRANARQSWQDGIHPDDDPGDGVDRDFSGSASRLLLQGAFNVNSVSIPAWAALLTSMMNVEVGPSDPPEDSAPFTRFLDPLEAALDEDRDNYYSASAYGGYRRIRAEDIWNDGGTPEDFEDDTGLAAEIVRQVRARGPFLSMSDFVNRALLPAASDPQGLGLAGALQTALDRSGINRMMGDSADNFSWIRSQEDMDHPWSWDGVPDRAFQGLSLDNLGGWTRDPVSGNPVLAAGGARNAGASGELTQADLLARIGAVLRPRSDTFLIRTAGLAGAPNAPGARAWAELRVQRRPDYVDAAANTPSDDPSTLSPANQLFGRRYEIISFRWLADEEL